MSTETERQFLLAVSNYSTNGDNVAVRVVQLGTPRRRGEGLRLGTVRRPPRGVPRRDYARQDWYDVWVPELAPSPALLRAARISAGDRPGWEKFARRYRTEMNRPEASRLLDLLAALSHQTNFSIGCYCADEARCHRSILRQILRARGALISQP